VASLALGWRHVSAGVSAVRPGRHPGLSARRCRRLQA
jgi:hypothetical protein